MHNETFNVWSHLIGAIFVVYLTLCFVIDLAPPTMHDHGVIGKWQLSYTDMDLGEFDSEICLAEKMFTTYQCKAYR